MWSTTDWFPSVRRSLHWTSGPLTKVGGISVVTSSFFLSRASWSKFYVLVYFLCVGDFLCLGEILLPWVILFRHAVTWWMTSSFYGGHVNLGMIFLPLGRNFCLGGISFVLAWFYTFGAIQPNLGMIFLRFGYNFRFSEIIFLLVSFHTLVRSTASWYDFPSFC